MTPPDEQADAGSRERRDVSRKTSDAPDPNERALHGAVAEAVVIAGTGSNRNFGFVTMADRKDAARTIEALHQSELDGCRIIVRIATERR